VYLPNGGGEGTNRGAPVPRAVVVMVTVAVAALVPSGVTADGETLHVANVSCVGFVQLSATDWLNPLTGVTVNV